MKFDDLFGEFFNEPKRTPLEESLSKIMKSLTDFRKITNDEADVNSMYDALGKPDEVMKHEEDGFLFEKHVWHRPEGHYVRIVVSEKETTSETESEPKSLEERLQDAVESENYELAIQLRDELKKEK